MRKILSLVLALTLVLSMSAMAFGEEMTAVGTPRTETLIVEVQAPTDVPGQFNTYMSGTQAGGGIHQMMSAHLWEMDTASGEQFGEVADGMPESNEDFTEHIVKIRQGIKWSDGVDLTAKDVAFTFNMIMNTPAIGCSAYASSVLESVEAVDDYTVKFVTKESFPRLALRFGVTIWGTDYRIVPEHIYSQVEDPAMFKDSEPVVAGPYTVKDYDPNGNWVLFQLREDYASSTMGVVNAANGIDKVPAAKYVWFKVLGDDTTRQMAMINNEVDVMCEVTPEILEVMTAQNPNVACWYNEFPYATSDDPCSKGIVFSEGQGAPYDNKDFRWAIQLLLDFDEISLSIFDGAGRASCLPLITATSAGQKLYYEPLKEWLADFELDLGDGTTFKPWDPDYATRMAEYLGIEGDQEYLEDMFGIGCWKQNIEAAEKLLVKAGFEKQGDVWYFNGEPFKCNISRLADTEAQAGRGAEAAYKQLYAFFGDNITFSQESSSTWDSNGGRGEYQIGGYWPTGFITKDVYSQINGWDADLITPVGETTSGQGARWNNERATEIIHEMAKLSPDDEKCYELGLEFLKIAVEELPMIGFHSGVKYVPTNSTYWTNYPTAENPYNGPWWWWSCFKYIMVNFEPAA